jgi:hypothetical protein
MKFGALKSIGHNIADSLASGICLMIGYYETDIFGEAARSREGYILVNFLSGTSSGGKTSESLARAIALYAEELHSLCGRHGTDMSAFRELTARYSMDFLGRQFVVTVEDHTGRRSTDEFLGIPGRRRMELDERGRVRPKRTIFNQR